MRIEKGESSSDRAMELMMSPLDQHSTMVDDHEAHQHTSDISSTSKKRKNSLHVTFPLHPTTAIRTRPRTLTAEKCSLFWTKQEMDLFLLACSNRSDESANTSTSSFRSEDDDQLFLPTTKACRQGSKDDFLTILNLFDDPADAGYEQDENDCNSNLGRRTSSVLSPLRRHRSYSCPSVGGTADDDEDGPHLLGSAFDTFSAGDGGYDYDDDIESWRNQ